MAIYFGQALTHKNLSIYIQYITTYIKINCLYGRDNKNEKIIDTEYFLVYLIKNVSRAHMQHTPIGESLDTEGIFQQKKKHY